MDDIDEQITTVQNNLKELDKKIQRTIIKKGLRVGAKIVQKTAKAQAPVKTGLLRRSIKVRSGMTGRGVTKMNIGIGESDYTGKAFYGAFLIYGHKQGKRALGDARKQIGGHNFLQNAFDGIKDQAMQAVVDSWKDQIEAAAPK